MPSSKYSENIISSSNSSRIQKVDFISLQKHLIIKSRYNSGLVTIQVGKWNEFPMRSITMTAYQLIFDWVEEIGSLDNR